MPCGGFDTLEPAAFFCAGEEGSRNPLLWKPGAEFSAMPGAVPEQPGSVGSGRKRPGTEAIRAWGVSGCGLICSDGEIRSLSAEGGTTGGVPGLSGGQGLGEVGFPGECFV